MGDKPTVKLTELSSTGGCAAKIGPGDLKLILAGLELRTVPELLIGMEYGDDAAVYKLTDDTALIQTLDFFTPIVDDPFTFGQIAAANALSDIYAMGGRPLLALNILAFPCGLGHDVLRAVLEGGADVVHKAGALVVGGHSIDDKEPKYGLAVSGLVHPRRLVSNAGARPGDALVLTKPIGFGILTTALRGRAVTEAEIGPAVREAATLNKAAAEVMAAVGVHAATDVTGFGLVGHLAQMMKASDCEARLAAADIPVWEGALSLVDRYQPGGTARNTRHYGPMTDLNSEAAAALGPILFDPQTSGGLLISVSESKLADLTAGLKAAGVPTRAVIGRVGPRTGEALVAVE